MFKSTNAGVLGLAFGLIIVALGMGIGIGYLLFQPASTEAASRLDVTQERVARLEASIEEKDARYQDLLAQVAGFKSDIALAQASNDVLMEELERQGGALTAAEDAGRGVRSELSSAEGRIRALETQLETEGGFTARIAELRGAIEPLASDRLLLVELRKNTPDNLEEAQEYWERVKELAIEADPTLGVKVDRVISFLPTYFDWFEGEYTDTCESLRAFFDSGAVEFGTLSGDLQSDVFLLLINRIDVATALVDN